MSMTMCETTKDQTKALSIGPNLESYYWATVVQVNLRYTGTSIYSHIFFCVPFDGSFNGLE